MRKKGEINGYLKALGKNVYKERKRKKMPQIEFYRFIMNDNVSSDENIKKKMNAIENAKSKTIDCIFFDNFCKKCKVSADFLFGYYDKYRNYDNEFVCKFTGLKEEAVEILHAWKEASDKTSNLPKIMKLYDGEEGNVKMHEAIESRAGRVYLSIINRLFESDKDSVYAKQHGLSILGALFKLCMGKVDTVHAKVLSIDEKVNETEGYEDFFDEENEYVMVDQKSDLIVTDNNRILHYINVEEIYRKKAKDDVIRAIDEFVDWMNRNYKR